MKKVIIALVVVGLLAVLAVGGVLAYAVSNANSLAQQYKPEMEKAASEALGSTVTLGTITAKVFPSAQLTIDDVRVTQEDESITLDRVELNVALFPLLSKRLEVRKFILERPSITVYLESDGVFIAGLPREEKKTTPEADSDTAAPASDLDISLDRFELRDATIRIVDRIGDREIPIDGLSVEARMSLENQRANLTNLKGKATLLKEMNFKMTGDSLSYSLVGGALTVDGLALDLEGNKLTLAGALDPKDASKEMVLRGENIRADSFGPVYDLFAPALNDLALKGSAKPEIHIAWDPEATYRVTGGIELSGMGATVAGMTVSELSGMLDVEADGTVMAAKADALTGKLGEESFTIKTAANLKDMNATVQPLDVGIFQGNVASSGKLKLADNMPFEAKLNIADMQFEPMVATLLPETPLNITGTLTTVDGNVAGTMDANLMPSIAGKISMVMSDGLIKEVNLGEQVLGAVNDIPFISGTLLSVVPDSLKSFLERDHTVLERVSGSFDIASETMNTQDLQVISDFFTMDAKGDIGFDSNLDLDAVIYFSPAFSQGMVGSVKQLEILLDDQGRLRFPVQVSGIAPSLTVVPDVGDLLEGAIKNTVENKAKDLVEGLIGGDKTKDGEKKKGGLLDRLGINN